MTRPRRPRRQALRLAFAALVVAAPLAPASAAPAGVPRPPGLAVVF